jgi:hypothetical protein
LPQEPQCAGLLRRSTHVPEQLVWPDGQLPLHVPALQNWPAGHAVPHPPQCSGLFIVSTHVLPHWMSPVGQAPTHAPDRHVWPAPHTLPHPPQFRPSVMTFAQVVPQSRSSGSQVVPSAVEQPNHADRTIVAAPIPRAFIVDLLIPLRCAGTADPVDLGSLLHRGLADKAADRAG